MFCDGINESCTLAFIKFSVVPALYQAAQIRVAKFAKFPGNFGNFPEILETSWDFWKVSGNLPEIFHPFVTLAQIKTGCLCLSALL